MNADETAKAPNSGAFQPGQAPVSGQQPVRRAGVFGGQGAPTGQNPSMPQSIPPAGGVPNSGTVPQRSAFRPTASPASGQQPASVPPRSLQGNTAQPATTAQPASGQQPVQPVSGQQPAHTSGAFAPAAAGAGAAAASSAGTAVAPAGKPTTGTDAEAGSSVTDRLRGLTGRAKDSTKKQLEKADREVAVSSGTGPRKARVLVSRIDPWSSLKIGFLLSIAAGIMLVVAIHVLWSVLNGMGVFQLIQEWVSKLFTADQELNILQFFEYSKIMSATLLISVVNVVLLTGLSVVATFLYNIISKVVGGVYMTLTDD